MRLNFRKSTTADWEFLLGLEKKADSKLYTAFTSLADLKKYLSKSKIFIVSVDKKPAGYISYQIFNKNLAEITGLVIDPSFRKKGLATYAIKKILRDLKNIKKVMAVTHPHNVASLRIYFKLGFIIDSWKDNHFGDGQPRLILYKFNS